MATYRERAWEIAVGQHGYITTRDATENGIPAIELVKLAARDRLQHITRGIYRFAELPTTRIDQFYEAALRVGEDAVLMGDAVLALHDLALVNPRTIRVATPHRVRRHLPNWVKVEQATLPDADVTMFEGIPITTVARAMLDAQPYVMTDRLLDAIPVALGEGLMNGREARKLKRELMSVAV
jgi:predicted transcriptional regulator of viral defense system